MGKGHVFQVMVYGGAKYVCEKVTVLMVVSQLAWIGLRRVGKGKIANRDKLK